jgi:hypothetical protein
VNTLQNWKMLIRQSFKFRDNWPMTHSYATRAWAMHHMANDFFGLQAIASMACVKPRTLQSWFRQETRRAKLSIKMPREYERAMGIILLDLYPSHEDQIASLVFTNVRTLKEWRVENRYRPLNSDLTHRTSEGVVILLPLVKKSLKKHRLEEYLTDKMLWPDPNLIYEKTWNELDEIFYGALIKQQLRNMSIASGRNDIFLRKFEKRVYVGPHFMRYTEIGREGQHFPLESFQINRPIKHLIRAGGLEAEKMARISNQLLPPDWRMKNKVVSLKSKSQEKSSAKVSKRAKKENSEPERFKDVG